MRALELNSEYYGISLLQLMENAGKNVADEIRLRFNPKKTKVAIFCGAGGNGGDGFVAARHLKSQGFDVEVFLSKEAKKIVHDSAKKNFNALQKIRPIIPIVEIKDSSLIPDIKADVIVDALLGIGTTGKLRPPIIQIVEKINLIR